MKSRITVIGTKKHLQTRSVATQMRECQSLPNAFSKRLVNRVMRARQRLRIRKVSERGALAWRERSDGRGNDLHAGGYEFLRRTPQMCGPGHQDHTLDA